MNYVVLPRPETTMDRFQDQFCAPVSKKRGDRAVLLMLVSVVAWLVVEIASAAVKGAL